MSTLLGFPAGPKTQSLVSLANLAAWWTMNEASGNRLDSSGAGRTLAEAVGTVNGVAGKIGNAANLDGTNYLARAAALVSSGAHSVALWVNLTADTGVIYAIGAATVTRLVLQVVTTQLQWGAALDVASIGVVNTGVWSHIAATYDGGTAYKLYLNGVLDNAVPGGGAVNYTSVNKTTVGANAAGVAILSGLVDAMGVWGRELTANEVATLYNRGFGFEYPFQF